MLRKCAFLLFGLCLLLLTACKKETALPPTVSSAVISSESTLVSTSESPTIARRSAATETIVSSSQVTSIPAQSSPTLTQTGLMTQKITPTSVPLNLEIASTATPAAADPTRMPTSTMPPEFAGFTPDELVNEGNHRYAVACQSWGTCVCDDTRTGSSVAVVIDFSEGVVKLSDPGGSFTYAKQAPSQYVLEDQAAKLELIFRLEGFQINRTEAGAACLQYTYIRDVSPK
jgi:hypothetical protein